MGCFKTNNNSKGFTIIEVLIVLVIAGMIMLIVFLAIPSMQRNNRNNQRKNDAARMLTAAKEWSVNNGGVTPKTSVLSGAGSSIQVTDIGEDADAIEDAAGDLSFYDGLALVWLNQGDEDNRDLGSLPDVFYNVMGDGVTIVTEAKCTSPTTIDKVSKSMIAVYTVEQASGDLEYQCISG